MVMVANQTGFEVGVMVGSYPGGLGHLYSPGAQRGPWKVMPYALDNGAFIAQMVRNIDWPEEPWRELLSWAKRASIPPLWALVPDYVGSRERTLALWERYAPVVREAGFRPAFAAQDGMTFADVPADDCVVFIGGTTAWKQEAIGPWCAQFPGRVHVGRVNYESRLWQCYEAGAISVDGTGWWHTSSGPDGGQRAQLKRFLAETHGKRAA